MTKAIVMSVIFIAFLLLLTWISGKKSKSFFGLLIKGAKLEVTTKPGWISLMTVASVAILTAISLLVAEVKSIMFAIFEIKNDNHELFPIGMFAVIAASIMNFLFIAGMRYLDVKEKNNIGKAND